MKRTWVLPSSETLQNHLLTLGSRRLNPSRRTIKSWKKQRKELWAMFKGPDITVSLREDTDYALLIRKSPLKWFAFLLVTEVALNLLMTKMLDPPLFLLYCPWKVISGARPDSTKYLWMIILRSWDCPRNDRLNHMVPSGKYRDCRLKTAGK